MSPTFTGAFRLMHGTALMRSRWLLEAAKLRFRQAECLRSEGAYCWLVAVVRLANARHVGEAHARHARLLLRRRHNRLLLLISPTRPRPPHKPH